MKILQLIYESYGSPFGFGGAGVRAYEIYSRLKERHDITLLCTRYPGARDGEIGGLRHLFLGRGCSSLARSVLSYTLKASGFVKRHGKDYDIIVENFLPSTPFFSRTLTGTPVVLQVQGIMEGHSLKKFGPLYSLPMYIVEKFYPFFYDKFIFVSDVTKEKLINRTGRNIRLCSTIPNGVSEDLLKVTQEDRGYILFFSRIDTYTKGLDLLIRAFEKISSGFPDIRLILAGYEFDRFEGLVAGCSPALKQKIEYAGFVTGDDKTRLLSGARLFVLPSRHESSPISILEAAACGKAVVTSDIPELGFVSREEIGLAFSSGDSGALAERMTELLINDDLRVSLGANGRRYASLHLWDRTALEFEEFLIKAVNIKKLGVRSQEF